MHRIIAAPLALLAAALFTLPVGLSAEDDFGGVEILGGGGATTARAAQDGFASDPLRAIELFESDDPLRQVIEQIYFTEVNRNPRAFSQNIRGSVFSNTGGVDAGVSITAVNLFAQRPRSNERLAYYQYLLLTDRDFIFPADQPLLRLYEAQFFGFQRERRQIDADAYGTIDLWLHPGWDVFDPYIRVALPFPEGGQTSLAGVSAGFRLRLADWFALTIEGYGESYVMPDEGQVGDAGGRAGFSLFFN